MRVQDYIADQAREAAAQAFRYAKAVPADKLDWAPEGGRTVLGMCRELALCPTWALVAFGQEIWNDEVQRAAREQEATWTTAAACEAEFARRFDPLDIFLRGMTDEDLSRTKWLPYNGGRDHTWLEMTDYVRWNCTYHTGQIAYIQTLYGDKTDY